jgi:RND family efflux transporter MFP subunit
MAQGRWTVNRIGRLAGLVLLVGGCLFVLLWDPPEVVVERPRIIRPAKLYEVQTVQDAVSRTYSGVVKAANEVDLAFRVSGPLVQMPIRRGQEVAEGDLIAQIDPRDFQTSLESVTSQLEQAQAQLSAMKAGAREEEILRLENQLRAAQAELDNAEVELTRYKTLLDEGVESQSEYDRVKLRRDQATEAKLAAEQRLAQGRKGARQEDLDAQEALIRGLEAQKRDAANALADTSLKAPFGGRIARQLVENFQEVRAGQTIVSLQDVSHVEVVADVPESLVAVVKRELVESMTVMFPSIPDQVFPVEFKEMETEADARTQTYAVTVTMPSPDGVNLLKGMPAELQITLKALAGKEEGVLVPVTAVFADDKGNPQAWIARPTDGKEGVFDVERRAVTVDTMTGSQILVTEGLKGGDLVVTAGVHFLDDESQVRRLQVER